MSATAEKQDKVREIAPSHEISRLIEIMAALRTPSSGCPWDLVQTFETIAPYTIEEAYEVADAIARRDEADLRDELGDLLLQVVYHARLAEEQSSFTFDDVVLAITDKMIRRHPHVFGTLNGASQSVVEANWQKIKAEERAAKGDARTNRGVLSGVALALPALTRAQKIQERAKRVGFDWPTVDQVFAKVREEIDEVAHELTTSSDKIAEEIGDLLFATVNLARHKGIDAEAALKAATNKFERRFAAIECALAKQNMGPADATLERMEALWSEVKVAEALQGQVPSN